MENLESMTLEELIELDQKKEQEKIARLELAKNEADKIKKRNEIIASIRNKEAIINTDLQELAKKQATPPLVAKIARGKISKGSIDLKYKNLYEEYKLDSEYQKTKTPEAIIKGYGRLAHFVCWLHKHKHIDLTTIDSRQVNVIKNTLTEELDYRRDTVGADIVYFKKCLINTVGDWNFYQNLATPSDDDVLKCRI